MAETAGVALIGLGMVAPTYLAALRDLPGLRLAGVLGSTPDSGAAFRDKHDLDCNAYADIADLVTDEAVDFALLVTPPNARLKPLRALAMAGKPVLMEKPLERDLPRATQLVEICEAANIPLAVMLQHRARPAARALRARDLGKLHAVEISVPWWRDQAYYDAPGRGSYARDGGGVLISQAIHTLDLALQFTGPVASVQAMCATTGLHAMEAEDFATAGLRFANGAVGHLSATTAAFPGRGEAIILHHATASAHLAGAILTLHHHSGETETIGAAATTGAGADPMAFTPDWHRAMIADFAACLKSGKTPIATARSALPVHALIAAIEASATSGQRIEMTHG